MCQKESSEAIVAPKEAHSTQRGQPPRMHEPGVCRHTCRYEQKEQRVTPVPMSGVNCDLWCPWWESKDPHLYGVINVGLDSIRIFLSFEFCIQWHSVYVPKPSESSLNDFM